MDKYLRLSVHQLVDFLLRQGDIDNRIFNRSSMNEGSRLHHLYQSNQASNYLSEVALSTHIYIDEIDILLEGRADGIIKKSAYEYVVDEIKTTVDDLETFHQNNLSWHLGQAKCYAYMFAKDHDLTYISVKLTYIKQGKEKEKLIDSYTFDFISLEQYVISLLNDYLSFYNIIFDKNKKRDETIKNMKFPFSNFRQGQKEMVKYCYAISKKKGRLFIEAPTGIGKTMSSLFPFIKAINDDHRSKIFYLTAKNSGKEAAHQALKILKRNGLEIGNIVITAKDKICFCKGKACNPDECPYAYKYYDKIQTVLRYSILNYDDFDMSLISQIAYENQICPFEFELDLSLFMDVIVGDYNYLFDPLSYMKRYFDDDASMHLVLVDEVHNLVERSRDMYSASLSYYDFLQARKSIRHSKLHKLKLAMSKMNKMFQEYALDQEDGNHQIDVFYPSTNKAISSFITTLQDVNKNYVEEVSVELMDFYLQVNRFSKILEFFDQSYLCYFAKEKENITLYLSCLDASYFLSSSLNKVKASVLFSATLSPIQYYVDILGGNNQDAQLLLPSPFPRNNFKIIVAPNVSIRYKKRQSSYEKVAEYIDKFIKHQVGNYLVFLPSYEYLNNLAPFLLLDEIDSFVQHQDMDDKQKDEMLQIFKPHPQKICVGFAVIGGTFSEGIDLIGDRLIGVVVVGIGLSKISFRNDHIASYYASRGYNGYEYAYINPGMNRVMQAIGRVIRSEKDRGSALLIDERYLSNEYRDLFKKEWQDYEVAFSPNEVSEILQDFFNK